MKARFVITLFSCFIVGLLSAQEPPVDDFYSTTRVAEIKVTFEQPNWEEELHKKKKRKKRLLASIEIDGVKYDSVGVRYKGNSSYNYTRKMKFKKLPFNIKLDWKKKKQKHQGYETLKLSNVFRDPSFVREILSYRIARDYMPASRCNFAKLYVNGEYLGVYTNVESVSEDYFFERHFNDNGDGLLFKCDPNWEASQAQNCPESEKSNLDYISKDSTCYMAAYELKSDYGWTSFLKMMKVLEYEQAQLEQQLNIERSIRMLAFNTVLVNLDSYSGRLCHNYYMYRDEFSDTWQAVIWDLNMSFGGFKFVDKSAPLTEAQLQQLSPWTHSKSERFPLISKLLEVPRYKAMYAAAVREILDDWFVNGRYLEEAKKYQKLIERDVQADKEKFYEYSTFKENLNSSSTIGKSTIIGLEELMKPRTEYLLEDECIGASKPSVLNAKMIGKDGKTYVTATIENADKAFVLIYPITGSYMRTIEMLDDGKNNDGAPGDGVYGKIFHASDQFKSCTIWAESGCTGKFLKLNRQAE